MHEVKVTHERMLMLRLQKSTRKTFSRNYKVANLLDPCLHQPRPSYLHWSRRRADVLQLATEISSLPSGVW